MPRRAHGCPQVLSALRHAHGRGLVHCDLKPQNIRLNSTCDRAVLTDWGLSRRLGSRSEPVTCGTPAYASPEQLTGYSAEQVWGRAKLGPPADVWALGATLYEMLTGRPPFCGATREALVANALALNYDTQPDTLGVGARQLIDSTLQVLPSDRASVHELCDDPWTTADEPMPPEEGIILVECGAGAPAASEVCVAAGRQCAVRRPTWAARAAMYVGYAALVGGALLYHYHYRGVRSAPEI